MELKNVGERISVAETQIKNLDEQIDELKADSKHIADEVEYLKAHISLEIQNLKDKNALADRALADKISEIENFKNKWFYIITGAAAVISFLIGHMNILQFFK